MSVLNAFQNGSDNSWCPVRIFGIAFAVLSGATFLALSAWTVMHLRVAFDYRGFGLGMSAIWAATGATIAGKAWAEKVHGDH